MKKIYDALLNHVTLQPHQFWGIFHISNQPEAHTTGLKLVTLQIHSFLQNVKYFVSTVQLIFWQASRLLKTFYKLKLTHS